MKPSTSSAARCRTAQARNHRIPGLIGTGTSNHPMFTTEVNP